ncbi:hypothetical protein TVAG_270880 [Trichomonas vaginalis G3]|uniref:Uncharacterized protein n=1 Tax=Trichomonas vaginalis (strain ATCC PRA-98 / G3) TaxID=412133 RepID=A2FII0_TRIV3|nr:hypothetical protein TVAG_270880 [Trichomonas vaginalis G3]|eukprot:XP_001308227.1 hypothetical protein [Trichomonas vaginalis G3]
MSMDNARNFAMKEASHIIELSEKVEKIENIDTSNEYHILVAELRSHFNNINGLLSALKSFDDDESKQMIEKLNQAKEKLEEVEVNSPLESEDDFIDQNLMSSDVDLEIDGAITNNNNKQVKRYNFSIVITVIICFIGCIIWFFVLQ